MSWRPNRIARRWAQHAVCCARCPLIDGPDTNDAVRRQKAPDPRPQRAQLHRRKRHEACVLLTLTQPLETSPGALRCTATHLVRSFFSTIPSMARTQARASGLSPPDALFVRQAFTHGRAPVPFDHLLRPAAQFPRNDRRPLRRLVRGAGARAWLDETRFFRCGLTKAARAQPPADPSRARASTHNPSCVCPSPRPRGHAHRRRSPSG